MDKGPVSIEWFNGAETNIAYNCLDRHVEAGKGGKVAMFWEGNDLDTDSKITYAELLQMVCRIANYLKSIGVKKGDDVTIYMPMVVELPAAMVRMCMHAAAFAHLLSFLTLHFCVWCLKCCCTVRAACSEAALACSWPVLGLVQFTLWSSLASQQNLWQDAFATQSQMWSCAVHQSSVDRRPSH